MAYVKNFDEWAMRMYKSFMSNCTPTQEGKCPRPKTPLEYLNNSLVYSQRIKGDTFITTVANLDTGRTAMAKCPVDEADSKIGIGVAYARLLGKEIPEEKPPFIISAEFKCGHVYKLINRPRHLGFGVNKFMVIELKGHSWICYDLLEHEIFTLSYRVAFRFEEVK